MCLKKSRSRNERENRNKKDRYPADKILSGGDFANASAILPIHSDLQPICRGGNHEIWSAEGGYAVAIPGAEAAMTPCPERIADK